MQFAGSIGDDPFKGEIQELLKDFANDCKQAYSNDGKDWDKAVTEYGTTAGWSYQTALLYKKREKYIGKQLRKGAKPNLFGKYRDSDYEHVFEEIGPTFRVVDQTDGQTVSERAEDYTHDDRANLDQAAFRTAVSSLSDGRQLIARWNNIGKDYSGRFGNLSFLFVHQIIELRQASPLHA